MNIYTEGRGTEERGGKHFPWNRSYRDDGRYTIVRMRSLRMQIRYVTGYRFVFLDLIPLSPGKSLQFLQIDVRRSIKSQIIQKFFIEHLRHSSSRAKKKKNSGDKFSDIEIRSFVECEKQKKKKKI